MMEALWQQLKADAVKWADSDRPLPTREQCVQQVGNSATVALPQHFALPEYARSFYADEFYGMVRMRRESTAKPDNETGMA